MSRPAVVACAAAMLVSSGACSKPVIEPRATIPVNVSITCTGTGMQASIDPYVVSVPEGDQVEWILAAASTVAEIEIDKKRYMGWPYDGSLPIRGGKDNPPKAGRMKEGQVGRTFGYNISATCTSGDGQSRKIVIDPDMIIIRRTE